MAAVPQPITDIKATYNDVVPPGRYHRCVDHRHAVANVNPGGSYRAYIWTKSDATKDPIVDIKVLYDGEPAPAGYTRVARDLGKGTDRKVHICFKCETMPADIPDDGSVLLPIVDVLFVMDNSAPEATKEGEAAWEKIDRTFSGAGTDVFMWVKRGTGKAAKWDPSKLEVGDIVDCKDQSHKWCVATVIERDGDNVKVRFKGWGSRWDDVLPITSDRIAPPRTKNPSDGPRRVKQGDDWEIEEKEIVDYEEKASDLINGRLDPETADKAERLQLLDWTQRNMRANHVPETIKVRVNESFQKVYEVICWRLKQYDKPVPKAVLAMWNQLMLGDDEAYYFFQHGGGCVPDSDEGRAAGGDFGRVPPGGASRFFVANINKFGEEGGFDAVIERLKIEDPEISPLGEIMLMITLTCICRFCFVPEFGTSFFEKALPLLVARFDRIDQDDVKSLDYAAADKMLREVKEMMKVLVREQDIDEIQTRIRLNLVKRVIMCSYMTKRLNGLKTLNQMCQRATNVTHRNADLDTIYASGPMAQWIVDNRILDSLLGAEVNGKSYGTHDEILRKLTPLLTFLARNDKIDASVIDVLWAPIATANPGDSTCKMVFGLVATTAKDLPVELLDHIYGLISAIPKQHIDETTLQLVRQFTDNAIMCSRSDAFVRWYGLDMLWDLTQDGAGVDKHIAKQAGEILVSMLTKLLHCLTYAPEITNRCIESLRSGESVPQNLQVLQALCLSVQVHGTRDSSMTPAEAHEAYLNHLQTTHDVVGLVLADMERFAKHSASMEDSDNDRFTVAEQWGARFDFLRVFLDNCATELDFEGIMNIWRIVCQDPVRQADSDVFMDWLRKSRFEQNKRTVTSYNCVVFNDDVVQQVFRDLLCNPEVISNDTLRPAGWKTLFAYFTYVNSKADKLFTRSDPPTVADPELDGIGVLWNVALYCPNLEVVKAATESLIALYVKLAPTLEKKGVWERFVRQCMSRVEEHQGALARDGDAEANEGAIAALLRLLRSFLHDVEKSGQETPTDRVTVYVRKGPLATYGAPQHVPFTEGLTVQELRQAVADAQNHPATQVRLQTFHRSAILHAGTDNDQPIMNFLHTRSLQAFLIAAPAADTMDHTAPVVATEDLDEDRRFPRELLANEYFSQLFDVLALHNDDVVRDTWALLSLLPVNRDIKESLYTLGGTLGTGATEVAWDELLDRHAVLKLLYALQIIDTRVKQSDDLSATDIEAQSTWCEAFRSSGGFRHLYSLVMDCDVAEVVSGPLSKKCLALMLKLLNFFMVVPDQFRHLQSAKEVPADIDYPGLVTRLLTLMRETSASAKPVLQEVEAVGAGVEIGGRDDDGEGAAGAGGAGAGAGAGGAGAGAGAGAGSGAATTDGKPKKAAVKTSTEAEIVRFTINLLVAIITQKPALLQDLYNVPDIARAFVFGVLQTREEPVREEVAKGILSMCTSLTKARLDAAPDAPDGLKTPREFFLPLLFDELPQAYKYPKQCTNYFGLLCKLVRALPPRLSRAASDDSATAGAGSGAGAGAALMEGLVPANLGGIKPETAVRTLADMISNAPVMEATPDDEDLVLRGILQLLTEVLRYRPGLKALAGGADQCNLCNEVFTNGLFAIPNDESSLGINAPPKCKHPDTRKAAFELLVELTHDSGENHQTVCTLTLPHHNDPKFKPKKKKVVRSIWDFDSAAAGKAACGYVGLRNLGCICYMNATNQNFFMVPKFRQAVLQFDDEEEDKGESVMYQLQRMFAHLQESERMFYDPKQFTVALKDMGEPTNVMVQKDAREYLQNLFQQMEEQIQGSAQEKAIKSVFGGVLCNELYAPGGHYSPRSSPCSFLSVNVKNAKNLPDALKLMVAGEQVDYKWDMPDGSTKQLPTTKRQSIKVLPPHLVIHLQRFEFDYTTFQQKKVNDRFEFPHKLNMKPYTLEGRPDKVGAQNSSGDDSKSDEESHPDEYYEYELMGIVVHSGTCNSGHYYSFIKERDSSYTGEGEDHRRWHQFNDTRVTPFNKDLIERETFGGPETYTYGGRTTTGNYMRSRNAFVLFYDRVPAKRAGSGAIADSTDASEATDRIVLAQRARKAILANRALVPPTIFDEIWQDNMEFWHRRNIFNHAYFNFVKELVSVPDCAPVVEYPDGGVTSEAEAIAVGGPAMTVVTLATAFVLETLVESKDKESMPEWVTKIKDIYANNIVACVWLLQSLMTHRSKLREYLLQFPTATRMAVAQIVSFALGRVAEHERSSYPDPAHPPTPAPVAQRAGGEAESKGDSKEDGAVEGDESKEAFVAAPRQVAVTFIETMLAMLPEAASNWRQFQEFFSVLASFAALDSAERGYLLGRSLIGILLDFVLGKDSPHPELSGGAAPATADGAEDAEELAVIGERPVIGPQLPPAMQHRSTMGDSQTKPQFSAVFELLKPLVFACKPPSASSDTSPSPHQQPPVAQLPALDADMLTCPAFVRRLMDELTSTKMLKTVKPLVEHLCWEDEALTNKFVGAIRDIVKKEEHAAKLKPSFRAMVLLCEVGDSKQAWRCEQVIGGVLEEMQANSQYFLGTETCISLLMRMAKHHDAVRTWLKEHGDAWRWVSAWLRDNNAAPRPDQALGDEGVTVQLHKEAFQRHGGMAGAPRSESLLPNIDRMLMGEDVENDGYDSDDEPDVLVGMRITVRWQGNAWYNGIVKAYLPDAEEHLVHYEDNDKKWYSLPAKTWRCVDRPELDWVPAVAECLRATHRLRPGVVTRNEAGELVTLTPTLITEMLAAAPAVARPAVVVEETEEDAAMDDDSVGSEDATAGGVISV